jgi:basic membrane protein A
MQSEAAVREAILDGADIVFAISWGFDAVCAKFAEIYPNVIFAHATGPLSNGKNFTNYFGRVYQARYLSGVVAGLKTKTNMVGYVAAKGKENSEVTGGLNAFAMGVESVNPKAKVYVVVTHNWDDSEAERLATRKLIQFGCDVIAQHCNLATPQIEAQKAGVWGIGYNTDMFPFAPDAVLTSVVWNWGAYYTKMVKSVIDGTFNTKPYFGGLEDGIVALAPLNRALSGEAINNAVAKARKRIEDGFAVFEGVLETNDARFIGRVGEVFADDYIRFKIDWYYHNVEELQ